MKGEKDNCRCVTEGKFHRPYRYAYRKQEQTLKSVYVGKVLKFLDEDA